MDSDVVLETGISHLKDGQHAKGGRLVRAAYEQERVLADRLAEEVRELAGYRTPALAAWEEARNEGND